jgi:hypothetical protein
VTLIGERTLQVAVFATTVKPGMIQVLCKELATHVDSILNDAAARQPADQAQEPPLGKDFSDAMKDQLDNLFGNL